MPLLEWTVRPQVHHTGVHPQLLAIPFPDAQDAAVAGVVGEYRSVRSVPHAGMHEACLHAHRRIEVPSAALSAIASARATTPESTRLPIPIEPSSRMGADSS
jgi:hypothetical protein